jgi:hypothetical protein
MNSTTAAYLMICGALGYLFGGLADAGWAVLIGVVSPYTLSFAVALFGVVVGAEPAPTNSHRLAVQRARRAG